MSTQGVVSTIRAQQAFAIIRADDPQLVLAAVHAVAAGGLLSIEFAFNGAEVLNTFRAARTTLPGAIVLGVGTVLDAPTARAAIEAGAQFIVSPTFRREVVETCSAAGVVSIPGASTPTEILAAWEAGADLVKVFPAAVYGPRFFRDVQGPLPDIPLVAVGGITVENAAEYVEAGAVAVGIGGGLVGGKLSSQADLGQLTGLVSSLLIRLEAARSTVEA